MQHVCTSAITREAFTKCPTRARLVGFSKPPKAEAPAELPAAPAEEPKEIEPEAEAAVDEIADDAEGEISEEHDEEIAEDSESDEPAAPAAHVKEKHGKKKKKR